MRDMLNNKLTPGNLVHWRFPKEIAEGGLIFRVIAVNESKLALVGGEPSPPLLTLQVDIPLTVERGKEAVVGGLMRVVDPRQEAALEAFSAGQGTNKVERPQ